MVKVPSASSSTSSAVTSPVIRVCGVPLSGWTTCTVTVAPIAIPPLAVMMRSGSRKRSTNRSGSCWFWSTHAVLSKTSTSAGGGLPPTFTSQVAKRPVLRWTTAGSAAER